jgi:cell division protein FtsZ
MSLADAFALADDVLRQAIQGISDLILVPGLINLDFPDVKTIMAGTGVAVMGTGMGEGENRAVEAAKRAISSPLLEDASIDGARGVIINVTGGPDLSLFEVSQASSIIHQAAHEDANIIFGAAVDPRLAGRVKITVIATGFDRADGIPAATSAADTPVDLQNYTSWVHGRTEGPWHPPAAAAQRTARAPQAPPAAAAPPAPDRSVSRPVPGRRPILALSMEEELPVESGAPGQTDADAPSDFDVPAFLRRQREA